MAVNVWQAGLSAPLVNRRCHSPLPCAEKQRPYGAKMSGCCATDKPAHSKVRCEVVDGGEIAGADVLRFIDNQPKRLEAHPEQRESIAAPIIAVAAVVAAAIFATVVATIFATSVVVAALPTTLSNQLRTLLG